jgi:hypothetical protein
VFESGRPVAHAVAAAEETRPVGFDLRLADGFSVDDGEMPDPDFGIAR